MTLIVRPETEAMLPKAARDRYDINTAADALLSDHLAHEQAEEVVAIRAGLEASDAGRVRPLAEVAAEKRAKYYLPTHLSDDEIFSGEEGIPHGSRDFAETDGD